MSIFGSCGSFCERCSAIAITTLRGLLRQKALLLLLIFSFFLLGSSSLLGRFSFQEEQQLFEESALGLLSFSLSIIAIVAAALVFPYDKNAPGLVVALSRPLSRSSYLLGKLLGLFFFLTLGACLMSLLFFLLLFVREETALVAIHHSFSLEPVQKEVLTAMLFPVEYAHLLENIFFSLLQSWVLAAATLMMGAIGSSSLFTLVVAVVFYFVGHLKADLKEFSTSANLLEAWPHHILIAVSSLVPNFTIFHLPDQICSIVTLSFLYIFFYFCIASFLFQRREI